MISQSISVDNNCKCRYIKKKKNNNKSDTGVYYIIQYTLKKEVKPLGLCTRCHCI